VHGKATASSVYGVQTQTEETVAVDASMAQIAAGAAELEDGLFAAVREQAESMIAWARSQDALAAEHHVLEERGMTDAMELARLLAQAHLDLRALREERRGDVIDSDGDRRVTCEDGQERGRVMIFGDVTTSRAACRKKGKPNLYPQDAELNWGPRCYPAGVERRLAEAISVMPAERAAAQVSRMGAVTVGKRQAEETAEAYAADFEGFYAARVPEPCPDDQAVLLTCDGSAFPVLLSALRPATAKAAAARAKVKEEEGWPDDPGELRKSRKRTAELAAVADIPPAPRVPGDILMALFGPARPGKDEDAKPEPGPKAQGKTLFASVARPAAGVIADAFAEAHRRDPEHKRPWIAVIDGNCHQIETVSKLAGEYGVQVTILIDLIHVTQYLWKAAGSFFYPGEPAARDWVREQTAKILQGKHRDVRAGIRRRATASGFRGTERAGADECARYLENKQDYLDYPGFLTKGWPVASGLIEGAARWLIKDRMEVTGARWSLDGAEAVLKLRAIVGCGDFDDYSEYHIRQEKLRNHDSRYQQLPAPATEALPVAA
jgi:hypothetical protein